MTNVELASDIRGEPLHDGGRQAMPHWKWGPFVSFAPIVEPIKSLLFLLYTEVVKPRFEIYLYHVVCGFQCS
jgi:hypothetical protein